MTQYLPEIGAPLCEVDTPSLILDLDAFERNLDLMANAVRGAGVALRPHAKSHKCPDIAFAQLERGAVATVQANVSSAVRAPSETVTVTLCKPSDPAASVQTRSVAERAATCT